ncbi:exonuclease subunit SbcD [Psychroflexus montanilacus]|uniref:exonuclease subunit SbcD n=1 Tax=Psychroflexus montanilacus TaxID=2873598 RepID=UPI001CC9D86B|nr:exonuclease subunit SbcD [Psychroflexus montanilacus]MBZ9653087.1 exonuclease subunit SbcD [Psychroflexus montanilacus]
MKILHTADWHIGKRLHKTDLSQDFDLFVNWLCNYLRENPVDVLLISGDVFDFSNPSSESRSQYYKTLIKLKNFNLKIIITGGNHDSPSVLEAPKEILNQLDIHVIGRMPDQFEDCLIPVSSELKTELIIAAIPYLRSQNLQRQFEAESHENKQEAVKESIAFHFQETARLAKENYPEIPIIGMGHLFATGASVSESERDIQIGNLAGLETTHFGNDYAYIALGHIHKPQRLHSETPIFYSGSPIPLSFSERKNDKRILVLDTEASFEPESISIPKFRELILIKGTLDEIKVKLEDIENKYPLKTLIEIELHEAEFSATKTYELEQVIEAFDKQNCDIVKHKVTFKNMAKVERGVSTAESQVSDFTPKEVFQKKLEGIDETENTKLELISAFEEILDELNRPEE